MPKGKRGPRGSKGRAHPVRLGIKVLQAPKGTTRDDLRDILLDSIARGDYTLPSGFIVECRWSNNGGKTTKHDEWENALADSATYGPGWDGLWTKYLTEVY